MAITQDAWKAGIRDVVREIADAEYQERVWRGLEPQRVSSPDEVYSGMFDEFLYSDAVELSSEQLRLGKKLHTALRKYSPRGGQSPSVEHMLADPAWHRVRQVAAEFLAVL